jgi:beta-glucosidase
MTLEEKAGQLSQWAGGSALTGPQSVASRDEDVRRGRVGSFLGVWGAKETQRLQHIAVDQTRLHIPLLFGGDVIHGFRTTFPVPLAEAASFDLDLARRCARAAAVEARANGLHWNYAPMVDVARDPRWGRVVEGAGEDPWLGAAFAVARVRGFQEPSLPEDGTALLATVKHFAAYGATQSGRDYDTVDISERTLREVYLPPFRAAVEAGAASLMTAFNEIAGVPMHAHRALVHDLLREQWGFKGIVVSDYTGIRELMAHGVSETPREAGVLAFAAGVDVDMVSGIYGADLPALIRAGRIAPALLDDAVRRVLEAKQRLGLFEAPFRYAAAERTRDRAPTEESRALAREAADKAIVLLKNQGQLLPLDKQVGSLAVIGALADDAAATLGSWSGAGRAEDAISVLQGIRQAVSPQTRVVYARGAAPTSNDETGFDAAERAARGADVVLLVVGESANMTGEAQSRASLALPGAQQALIERLYATGKPLVVLLMNGRPLAIPWVAEHVPAILETWYLGLETGHAVADVLFGDVNPSGKLPISFPRAVGQVPIYYAHKPTGRPPSASEYYTSKYSDVPWTPLYAFGHGLSYTQFKYGPPRLSARSIAPTDTLRVSVTVTNTGRRAGEEVVQLYVRDEVASFTRPVKELRGFVRIALAAGAAREVSFSLEPEDLALLDGHFERVIEPGKFSVFVGTSSAEVQAARFEVTRGARLAGSGSAIPRMLRVSGG